MYKNESVSIDPRRCLTWQQAPRMQPTRVHDGTHENTHVREVNANFKKYESMEKLLRGHFEREDQHHGRYI